MIHGFSERASYLWASCCLCASTVCQARRRPRRPTDGKLLGVFETPWRCCKLFNAMTDCEPLTSATYARALGDGVSAGVAPRIVESRLGTSTRPPTPEQRRDVGCGRRRRGPLSAVRLMCGTMVLPRRETDKCRPLDTRYEPALGHHGQPVRRGSCGRIHCQRTTLSSPAMAAVARGMGEWSAGEPRSVAANRPHDCQLVAHAASG